MHNSRITTQTHYAKETNTMHTHAKTFPFPCFTRPMQTNILDTPMCTHSARIFTFELILRPHSTPSKLKTSETQFHTRIHSSGKDTSSMQLSAGTTNVLRHGRKRNDLDRVEMDGGCRRTRMGCGRTKVMLGRAKMGLGRSATGLGRTLLSVSILCLFLQRFRRVFSASSSS